MCNGILAQAGSSYTVRLHRRPRSGPTLTHPGSRVSGFLGHGGVLHLVLNRRQRAQRGVAPAQVVPDLEVVEDRVGQLDPRLPPVQVE